MTTVSEPPFMTTAGSTANRVPTTEECIGMLVEVLPRITRVFKAQIRGGKLSAQHVFLMMGIDDLSRINEDGAQPGELARRACLSSAAITAALDDLVEGAYCVRAHSEKDRRKVLVHLTPAGRQVLDEIKANARESLRGLLNDWGDERRLELCRVLADLDGLAASVLSCAQANVERASSN